MILSIDQGTTSTRAMLFDMHGKVVGSHQVELPQIYPQDGWVEHDPAQIWADTLAVCRAVLSDGADIAKVAGIGITNQRETSVVWERASGKPLYNAIVWQDRRTADLCARLKAEGREAAVQEKTGLLLDPYFSGTKLAWLLDHVPDGRVRAKAGELCFGTIDSWLIWNLTGGGVHATDATNASRTLLFNIGTQDWDDEILAWLDIPREILPEVKDCAADFGQTVAGHFGKPLQVAGVVGDQQAASFGQACFEPGMMKSTYGTGCFALVNTGAAQVTSQNRLLGTVAYRLGGEVTYALEGSIFMAGAIMQWMRDQLGLMDDARASAELAASADPASQAILVPAFTGLGAPYWDPHARGSLLGMTRDTGSAEIVRAGIESVSYQTRDLMEAMGADMALAGLSPPDALRVDGGMVANTWFLQNLADILARPVDRPTVAETTALGAAYVAGLQTGVFDDRAAISAQWQKDRAFRPEMPEDEAQARYERWKKAVGRVLTI